MAGWDDVRRIALDLPGAVEEDGGRTRSWRVGGKAFAWERLLRRGERAALGDRAPEGPARRHRPRISSRSRRGARHHHASVIASSRSSTDARSTCASTIGWRP